MRDFFECLTPEFYQTVQKSGLVLLSQLSGLSKNVSGEKLVPLLCCSVTDLLESLKKTPSPDCRNPKIQANLYLVEQVNRLTKDLMDFMCDKWYV